MCELDRDARKKARDEPGLFAGRSSSDRALGLTMRDRLVACCPCFETLASLAPQHEVVVFQRVRPHPRVTASPLSLEEVTNGSRECAPDDRLRGRLEGWAAIPICDSRY